MVILFNLAMWWSIFFLTLSFCVEFVYRNIGANGGSKTERSVVSAWSVRWVSLRIGTIRFVRVAFCWGTLLSYALGCPRDFGRINFSCEPRSVVICNWPFDWLFDLLIAAVWFLVLSEFICFRAILRIFFLFDSRRLKTLLEMSELSSIAVFYVDWLNLSIGWGIWRCV